MCPRATRYRRPGHRGELPDPPQESKAHSLATGASGGMSTSLRRSVADGMEVTARQVGCPPPTHEHRPPEDAGGQEWQGHDGWDLGEPITRIRTGVAWRGIDEEGHGPDVGLVEVGSVLAHRENACVSEVAGGCVSGLLAQEGGIG